MIILERAWNMVGYHATEGAAGIRNMWSAFVTNRSKRRAVTDLEVLPRSVLRDIGIRWDEIPVVVENAMRKQRERTTGKQDLSRATTAVAEIADSVVRGSIAQG